METTRSGTWIGQRADEDSIGTNPKMREINPFGLRLTPDLKKSLIREAKSNNRSLNAEIVHRLEDSLRSRRPSRVGEPQAEYQKGLSDVQRAMLAIFDDMSPEKQLALISLFK